MNNVTVNNIDNQIYFEPVAKYVNAGLALPERKTSASAGYDFVVAEDKIIPSYDYEYNRVYSDNCKRRKIPMTIDEMSDFTKANGFRPTLVSTGMKCHMPHNTYLELSVRSSTPLKNWLILANGVGIIDADYYNNPDNEGEIFFQLINLSPFPIQLRKGDIIGQGIIKPYLTTTNDKTNGIRTGGFGSTTSQQLDCQYDGHACYDAKLEKCIGPCHNEGIGVTNG